MKGGGDKGGGEGDVDEVVRVLMLEEVCRK